MSLKFPNGLLKIREGENGPDNGDLKVHECRAEYIIYLLWNMWALLI